MANGIWGNGGVDSQGDNDVVDTELTGPIAISKTGDGGGADVDPLVLDQGDSFTITGSANTFVYVGTDGAGGVLAVNFDTGASLWLSDTVILNNDPWPTLVAGNTAICFAPGTLIATPTGETTVETLAIGDLVSAADGRAVPVRWIGRQTLHRMFAGERACPVRVAAGALGGGLPHSDLVLTADHALILDGLAVNAGALVNGTTITRTALADLPERVTYYHIETADHDVILANGAAAETFVDYIGRQAFDNHAEYVALYGDDRVIAEMPLPRVSSRRQLPASLRERFGIEDFAEDVTAEAEAFIAARRAA